MVRGGRAHDLLSPAPLKVRLDHLVVLAVGEDKRAQLATPLSNVIDVLAAVVVEANGLGVPLDLQALQVGTVGRERLDDLVDVDARGDLLEPAERRAHHGHLDVGHSLYRADPELLGDFHAARVREAA